MQSVDPRTLFAASSWQWMWAKGIDLSSGLQPNAVGLRNGRSQSESMQFPTHYLPKQMWPRIACPSFAVPSQPKLQSPTSIVSQFVQCSTTGSHIGGTFTSSLRNEKSYLSPWMWPTNVCSRAWSSWTLVLYSPCKGRLCWRGIVVANKMQCTVTCITMVAVF